MEKNPGIFFFIKNLNFFSTEERMIWTSWMTWGCVNKLSAIFFLK